MNGAQHTKITNFIWGIADEVLRDLYHRTKYRDVILPMTVLRRLDAVLEPTKAAVLELKEALDVARVTNQDASLRSVAGQAFYNTSKFTLKDLRSRASQQQLRSDFESYLDGFSPNVQDILANFEFRNQIPRLSKADALGSLIEKFLDPTLNLSPKPVLNPDGSPKQPGLDNHGVGTIFEELVRRFNEENNEEAGEHWTPRDAVKLMARLIFLPIADGIDSGTYLLYDGAAGTGGMLTVAEETLQELGAERGKEIVTHLYGQEINPETYAICKADLLLKGEGEGADNIVGGPEYSTLSNDAFPSRKFDFMLSNPPYGKSWKGDLERLGGKRGIRDPRFVISHADDAEYSLLTRSSDGQMLFLANLVSKMKHGTKLGSRIAEVHNGSSLFTGEAGSGESNIRRWIIENDWLEAIIALPLNMFYNTPIATFVWVLSNRKAKERRGRVQLVDATSWFQPLRKRLGMKSCELSPEDIDRICREFLAFEDTEYSRVLDNAAFGYWRVTVEHPLRAVGADPERAYSPKDIKALRESGRVAPEGTPVIRRIHRGGQSKPDPLRGLFSAVIKGADAVVEYEPDSDLRDSEQVPFLEPGGVDAFITREVLPHDPRAWIDDSKTQVGYEISFNRYFSKPKPLRELADIRGEIVRLEGEMEGLLAEIVAMNDRAVVRGLDPTKGLTPSGVEWIGDVPGHWQLLPNRSLFRIRKQVVGSSSSDYTLLSLTLDGVVPRDLDNPQGKFPSDFESYQLVEPGDIIFCLFDVDETPRTVGLAKQRGMVTGAYTVFSCVDPDTAKYLFYLYLSLDNRKALRPLYTGLRKVIKKEVFMAAKTPLPPKDERDAIVRYIETELAMTREAAAKAAREVQLMKEYRARLVADVVTGKLDVRDAANALPDIKTNSDGYEIGNEPVVGRESGPIEEVPV